MIARIAESSVHSWGSLTEKNDGVRPACPHMKGNTAHANGPRQPYSQLQFPNVAYRFLDLTAFHVKLIPQR